MPEDATQLEAEGGDANEAPHQGGTISLAELAAHTRAESFARYMAVGAWPEEDFTMGWPEYEESPEERAAAERLALEVSLEPTPYPTHPDWRPTIYINLDVLPHESMWEKAIDNYERRFGRQFAITTLREGEIEQRGITKFPLDEWRFRRRGYFSDIDYQNFGRGEVKDSRYAARCKTAAQSELSVLAVLMGGPQPAAWTPALHTLLRRYGGLGGNWTELLLERNGVLLPGEIDAAFDVNTDVAHFAMKLRWKNNEFTERHDPFPFHCADLTEVSEQIAFERTNCSRLFRGATRLALVLWHAQVLAALRKAAWRSKFEEDAPLTKAFVASEAQKAKQLDLLRHGHPAVPVDDAETSARRELTKGELQDHLNEPEHFAIDELDDFIANSDLQIEQNVIAALHGSPYKPRLDLDDVDGRNNPLRFLLSAAEWIGALKHRRHALLTPGIAATLHYIEHADGGSDYWESPHLHQYRYLIRSRLGDKAWRALAEPIAALVEGRRKQPMSIVYEWTQDPRRLWTTRKRGGALIITGALLDFPINDVALWNERAEALRGSPLLRFPEDEAV